jgi:hypothetical protein
MSEQIATVEDQLLAETRRIRRVVEWIQILLVVTVIVAFLAGIVLIALSVGGA